MESSYAAGVFDGEGTVGLYAVSNGKGSGKIYWASKLAVVGTHRPMIEALHKHFGVGSFTTQKRQAIGNTPQGPVFGKQGWRWYVTSKGDVALVLEQILPFLIEKREQAEAALAYCRGELSGEEAARLCKEAKQFVFPVGDFEEYAPRRNSGHLAGANNPASTTTEEQAREVKRRLALGHGGSVIARELGLSKHIVSKIKTGKTWSHLT